MILELSEGKERLGPYLEERHYGVLLSDALFLRPFLDNWYENCGLDIS